MPAIWHHEQCHDTFSTGNRASGIISNTPMKEIFETAVDYSSANYHIVEHKNREKVILCSCASGMGTAEKLKKILVDSLPCDLPIHVYTYDYNTLLEKTAARCLL